MSTSGKEGLPQSTDASANAGQELRLTPFTAQDLGWKLFYEQWNKDEVRERNLDLKGRSYAGYMGALYYYLVRPETGLPSEPYLQLNFSPFIAKGQVLAATLLFSVNSAYDAHPVSADWESWKKSSRRYEIYDPTNGFRVYDSDVDKIDDPTYLNECREITAREIFVATDLHDAGRNHGWVTDPHQKDRINEWFQGYVLGTPEDKKRIRKFIQLRQAPFRTNNVPEFGEYTYEGIKEEVVYGHRSRTFISGVEQPNVHFFTQEDLDWVETFTRNTGIPIPDRS